MENSKGLTVIECLDPFEGWIQSMVDKCEAETRAHEIEMDLERQEELYPDYDVIEQHEVEVELLDCLQSPHG